MQHDDLHGLYQIAPQSQYQEVLPAGNSTTFVTFTILRAKGQVGSVNVSWQFAFVGGNVSAELSPTSGVVMFADQQPSNHFQVRLLQSTTPSDVAFITLRLTNATSGGVIDPVLGTTNLTRLPENNAFGVFVIDAPSRSITVSQPATFVSVTIRRTVGFFRAVQVFYQTALFTMQALFDSLVVFSLSENPDAIALSFYYPPVVGYLQANALQTITGACLFHLFHYSFLYRSCFFSLPSVLPRIMPHGINLRIHILR